MNGNQSSGQGLVEYAIIMALVAMVVLGLLLLFGGSVGNIFSNVQSTI
jgi:pilus assembly protein Flp/PilA